MVAASDISQAQELLDNYKTYWYIPTSLVDKAYQNARTKQYQFNDLCLLYLKISHHPVIHDPLNQTDPMSTPIASVDVGK